MTGGIGEHIGWDFTFEPTLRVGRRKAVWFGFSWMEWHPSRQKTTGGTMRHFGPLSIYTDYPRLIA